MKRFFEEISNKIIWVVLVLVFLSLGYVFLVRNFLNPPKTSKNPTNPTKINPINPVSNDNNPTTPVAPVISTPDNSTPVTTPDTQETTFDPLEINNPNDWQPTIKKIPKPSKKVIPVPKKLERGAVLSIYENEIEELNPEPHLYEPKSVVKISDLRFSYWNPKKGEFQEVTGYFYIPESGNYKFYISGISHFDNKYYDRNFLSLSINGIALSNRKGGNLNLEKGWHYISFYLNPKPQVEYKNVGTPYVNVYWGKGGLKGRPLKPLIVYRSVEEAKK